jgi:hypothetical protein
MLGKIFTESILFMIKPTKALPQPFECPAVFRRDPQPIGKKIRKIKKN